MTERPTAADNGERTSDVAAPPPSGVPLTRPSPADAPEPATTGDRAAATPPEESAEPVLGRLYTERLYLPWFHWLLPLVAAGLLAAELHMGFPVIPVWLPYLIFLPVAVAGLMRLGNLRVQVLDGELWASDAHLPVRFIGTAEVVTAERKRKTLGPLLDPTAFVVHRGWVPTMIRIEITDPADPTPYWLVSTRRPGRLIEALQTAAG